jgi:hypothetical protein
VSLPRKHVGSLLYKNGTRFPNALERSDAIFAVASVKSLSLSDGPTIVWPFQSMTTDSVVLA